MQNIKTAMESGFGEFLAVHRITPSTRLTLVQFDGENPYEEVYVERPIADAPALTLTPRGMTPLRDALCMAIDKAGQRLASKKASLRPEKVLFLVMTDGLENASRRYSLEEVKQRIDRQTGTYSWEFVYLGANQDALLEAGRMGMDLKKAITFDVNKIDPTWRNLARNSHAYATSTLTGAAAGVTLDWNEVQRKEVDGKTK